MHQEHLYLKESFGRTVVYKNKFTFRTFMLPPSKRNLSTNKAWAANSLHAGAALQASIYA
jgi:hypothetical protein